MSNDVIELIDGVIAQHGDAMRWSPDAEPQTVGRIAEWVEAHVEAPLTDWQAALLDSAQMYQPDGRIVHAHCRCATFTAPEPGWYAVTIRLTVLDEIKRWRPDRSARLRRIHTAYSRRRR